MAISANDVREELAKYLAGDIDLGAFEDWIAQNTWDIHQWGDSEANELVCAVELCLSEHSAGHLPEQLLRKELLPFVTNVTTKISFGPVQQITLGLDVNWSRGWLQTGEPADRAPVVVFD